jgi:hypothetical protein
MIWGGGCVLAPIGNDFAGVQAAGEILDQVGEAGVGQGRWQRGGTHDAFSRWQRVSLFSDLEQE